MTSPSNDPKEELKPWPVRAWAIVDKITRKLISDTMFPKYPENWMSAYNCEKTDVIEVEIRPIDTRPPAPALRETYKESREKMAEVFYENVMNFHSIKEDPIPKTGEMEKLLSKGELPEAKDVWDLLDQAQIVQRNLEAQLSLLQKKMDRAREALSVSLGSFNFIENICLSWDPDERSKNDNVENLYFMESIINNIRKEANNRIGDEALSTQDQETKEG